MISFFACTGYKHFGHQPPLSFYHRHDGREFRDNMLYLSLAFSDWKGDQEMLRFAVDTHFNAPNFASITRAIQPFVQANMTPRLHVLAWQHSIDTEDEMRLDVSPREQLIERLEEDAVTVQWYIAHQRAYYAAEYARYAAEERADAQRGYWRGSEKKGEKNG